MGRSLLLFQAILLLACALAQPPGAVCQEQNRPDFRGWDYLAGKLRQQGVPEARIAAIYGDPRLPVFSTVHFALEPKESAANYRRFGTEFNVRRAQDFIEKHKPIFAAAEKELRVPRSVVAAILLIETHFGKNIGSSLVIERLSRVASVAAPENIAANYAKLKSEEKELTIVQVARRARYLEELFLPEIPALIEVADKAHIDIFELRGSKAGAFGIPQFLPSSYLKYAVDGDRNGTVSLFEEADAIWSAANYLASLGWRPGVKRSDQERIISSYNNSRPYVEAVLHVAALLTKAEKQGGGGSHRPAHDGRRAGRRQAKKQ